MVAPRQDSRRSDRAEDRDFGIPGVHCLEQLGAGLRGTLYKATDGHRTLAVKVLRRGVSFRRDEVGRFVKGAPDRIRHPNLPAIESLGETRDGLPYYSMALLRGDSLRTLIDELRSGASAHPSLSPLSPGPDGRRHPELPRRAAELIAEAAEGLALAHGAGIVHRRLSPRNLVLTPAGRLVVTDFGGEASIEQSDDLAYRAPEQLDPFPEHIGASTDVYTLGVILFEILTARLPFSAASPHDLQDLILRGLSDNKAAAEYLGLLRGAAPPELAACVLKAMANDPTDRYAAAAELAADLRRFLRHEEPLAAARSVAETAPSVGRTGYVQRTVAACALTFFLGAFWLVSISPWVGTSSARDDGRSTRLTTHDPGTVLASPALVSSGLVPSAPLPGTLATEARLLSPAPEPRSAPAIKPQPSVRPSPDLTEVAASWLSAPRPEPGDGRVSLDDRGFIAIHEALEERNDELAQLLLCAWDLDLRERVDAAPRPAFAWLFPNLEVEVGPEAPRNWTARWVSAMALIDPESLLDASSRLAGRDDLLGHLLGTLQSIDSEESRETILRIVRERPMIAGRTGLQALAVLAAHTQLLDIVRSPLPLDLRVAALERLGELSAGAFLPELQAIALTSPEPALRALTLEIVARYEDADAVAALVGASNDPELAGDAVSHLLAMRPDAAAAGLVELLRHPRLEVRTRAAARLADAQGADVVAPLCALLLDRRRDVREAAFAALEARDELRHVPAAMRALLGGSDREPAAAELEDLQRGIEQFLRQAHRLAAWGRRSMGSSTVLGSLHEWAAAHLESAQR